MHAMYIVLTTEDKVPAFATFDYDTAKRLAIAINQIPNYVDTVKKYIKEIPCIDTPKEYDVDELVVSVAESVCEVYNKATKNLMKDLNIKV